MPCTFGSALYAATTASTSSSVASPGRSVPKDSIPASAHAFFFERTYVSESLRSPTSTTARPGTLSVLSFIAATFARTSSRTVSAMALPSMIAASARAERGRTRAVARVPRRRRGAGAESFQPRGVVEIADIACSGCGDRRPRAAAVEKSVEAGAEGGASEFSALCFEPSANDGAKVPTHCLRAIRGRAQLHRAGRSTVLADARGRRGGL